MYRVTKMSEKIYAKNIDSVKDDAENIEIFANEATPVIICDSISDLEEFGISEDEVIIIA